MIDDADMVGREFIQPKKAFTGTVRITGQVNAQEWSYDYIFPEGRVKSYTVGFGEARGYLTSGWWIEKPVDPRLKVSDGL